VCYITVNGSKLWLVVGSSRIVVTCLLRSIMLDARELSTCLLYWSKDHVIYFEANQVIEESLGVHLHNTPS
jgi:hypothetical protein